MFLVESLIFTVVGIDNILFSIIYCYSEKCLGVCGAVHCSVTLLLYALYADSVHMALL